MKIFPLIILLTLCVCCSGLRAQPNAGLPGGGRATPVESITLPDGFRAQLLRSARKGEGSWVSMTFDDRGRLILGRDNRGVVRLTLSDQRDSVDRFEVVEDTFKHCRGVLYAHDSLYVCATDSKGFYRLRDTTGDDQFDDVQLLKAMKYESRYGHGTNQISLGPDSMIYVVNGNDVAFPEGAADDSPYRDPHNDQLLPQPRDATGDRRVGHILRTDPDGKHWEVIAGGFRNQIDVAFNADGEMFTYDADMEWDVGLPWYRPTRINHVVSGGEYGWRWGSGKWPSYYADSLPTTLDTGLGSPTGIEFGTRSDFPAKYRESLFLGDWQNGRILRVDVRPRGASYECEYDVFLEGGALNVCDLTFGPDGAMYFITGGRDSQSGLYRVWYDDSLNGKPQATVPSSAETRRLRLAAKQSSAEQSGEARAARRLRHRLESFHGQRDDGAVDFAWPHLDSDDRWLRFAARLAVERQDPAQWSDRALAENRPTASIAALLALARLGRAADQPALLDGLDRLPLEKLNREQLLDALRVWQLSFVRQGRPSPDDRQRVLSKLNPLYPHTSNYANRELFRLLIYLDAPQTVPRAIQVMRSALAQEDAIFHAQILARIDDGWTTETRAAFFDGLLAARGYQGGKNLYEWVAFIREDAIARLTDQEKQQLRQQLEQLARAEADAAPILPQLPVVKDWSWNDLESELPRAGHGRSQEQGKAALAKASCIKCHRFGEQGSFVGPDLTRVGRRFDQRALLESILLPSKVIDEKYRVSSYLLDTGKVITGRPVGVSAKTITLQTVSLPAETIVVQRDEIEASSPANVSPMPSGLANVLTKEEILDLIAYLKSGGND